MALSKEAQAVLQEGQDRGDVPDVDLDLLIEREMVTPDGAVVRLFVFDEAEVNRRIAVLREAVGPDAPAHLRQAYNAVAGYHLARRQNAGRDFVTGRKEKGKGLAA